MASVVSKPRKETSLKPKHRRVLKNLSKTFHALGINIQAHIESFELDEEELNEIRKIYGTSTFLGPRERTMLRETISNILSVMKAVVVLEELIAKQVAPYVHHAAMRRAESPDVLAVKTLHKIYSKPFQTRGVTLKSALPQIRKYLLGSFANEQQLIFKKYQRLLGAIEANMEDLQEIEARKEKISAKISSKLSSQTEEIRQMLFEDIYYLTRDIAQLYDTRVELYKWLVEADKSVSPRLLPMLEVELNDVLAIRNYYIDSYKTHLKYLTELYIVEEK
ncbi:TPA: hypothetical protein H1012_03245 [archaeon]|nr:hypothetical protein [Candidatus Naiadarchaeales archaeon SRR2090159.bin1288]